MYSMSASLDGSSLGMLPVPFAQRSPPRSMARSSVRTALEMVTDKAEMRKINTNVVIVAVWSENVED